MNGAAGANLPPAESDDGDDAARYADLQALILDASTTLVSANPDELDTKLEWTLRSVATGLDADYAAVYDADPEGAASTDRRAGPEFDRLHTWTAGGGQADDPDPETDDGTGASAVERALDRVGDGEIVRRSGGDAAGARDGPAGHESVLAVPILREYELWGVLVFAAEEPRGRWHDHEVVLVRSLADMVASSLDRVERERRLAAQNERLEQFASVVSHDLRNPLNVLTGSLDLAERTGDADHFDRARRAADRMDGIIDTVLDLARAGRDIGETEVVDVGRVARTAWEGVDTREATLVVDDPGQYEADENRLADALSNLFRNAVEHGGTDVTVTVVGRADASDGFYVADDGAGFPSGTDGLFERGRSGDVDGTGLGLTIVERVVEAHGWTVEAGESEHGGARFDVAVEE
ncbi:sensor histidine kinase [Halobaculum sp. EA56]|uniref:sensor histidine kinase n=1 Tax=Halobaculum sp. EA56 TaxID=3421648 RepID=UPI003EB89440